MDLTIFGILDGLMGQIITFNLNSVFASTSVSSKKPVIFSCLSEAEFKLIVNTR
jgi:hypothetical protein